MISCFSFTELAKRAAEMMPESGGAMLTLTYGGSMRVMPNYNVMGLAKAALEASVRYLANDFGPRGIRVNAISAGPVRTLAGAGISDARYMFSFQRRHTPLRRTVTIDEVGGSALYLLSDLSSGVTGDIHFVDSGYNIISMPRAEALKLIDEAEAVRREPRQARRRGVGSEPYPFASFSARWKAGRCSQRIDVAVERRPRRHHLEQPHREVQPRADHDVGGGELVAEQPRTLLQRLVQHVEHLRRVAPAGGARRDLDLGEDLDDRRLDAARREEQPVEIFRAPRIAERRRKPGVGIALGDVGADRRLLRPASRRRPSAREPCPSD